MLPASFRSSVTQRFIVWFGAIAFCSGTLAVTQFLYNLHLNSTVTHQLYNSDTSQQALTAALQTIGAISRVRAIAEGASAKDGDQLAALEAITRELSAVVSQAHDLPGALANGVRAFAQTTPPGASLTGSPINPPGPGGIDWQSYREKAQTAETALLADISKYLDSVRKENLQITQSAASHQASYQRHMLFAFTLTLIVLLQILIFERLWLVTPIKRFTQVLIKPNKSDGNYLKRHAHRQDEIGVLGGALVAYQISMEQRQARSESERERLASEITAKEAQQVSVERFRDRIAAILSNLEGHAVRMETQSDALARTASEAERQTLAATASTSETTNSIESVSVSVGELSRTIGDIHTQIVRATEIVSLANGSIRNADEKSTYLVSCTQSIEKVIELIQSVAERTNLLSLNATIEAARAGEVGRGFAVVASEIKTLAIQTARATGDIRGQLQSVIDASDSIASIIRAMVSSMGEIDEIARVIAAAAQSQNLATRDIDEIANRTAKTARRLDQSIGSVAAMIGDASKAAQVVHAISDDLTLQAAALRQSVEQFMQTSPATVA